MPGLRVAIGGGRGIGAGSNLGQTGGATIAQTAYGAAGTTDDSGRIEHWHTFMGVQVAALAWLVFLRWSLPSGRRSE